MKFLKNKKGVLIERTPFVIKTSIYFAKLIALVSRITVIFICPG
jgi:hypothetical protein